LEAELKEVHLQYDSTIAARPYSGYKRRGRYERRRLEDTSD
jgi:hypothetical protein